MLYNSTRGQSAKVTAPEAIIKGLASDGGLLIPEYFPVLSMADLLDLQTTTYQERAQSIMGLFLPEFSGYELANCINAAYNSDSFDHPAIAPLVQLSPGTQILELWHGPTSAFKDMALQILPQLHTVSKAKTGSTTDTVILVATSGDTGKAALEGFKNVQGTQILVFYPRDGVSEVQKQQMLTQEGNNVMVAGVIGNFDDAQSGVKRIFSDPSLIERLATAGLTMSSANSINWGRLLPQIVYYVSAYVDLVATAQINPGDAINFVVPTGNFGNILAGYYASRIGVPINKLLCASNANNVLTDFLNTGIYDRNRTFYQTMSPSMDILISSNLERLLYEMTDHDAIKVRNWMQELNETGRYQVDTEILNQLKSRFIADYCDDATTLQTISETWLNHHYLLDTHTAVAVKVYERYREKTGDPTPTVIVSTASPFKFTSSVAQAVLTAEEIALADNEFALVNILAHATSEPIPIPLRDLDQKPVLHSIICDKSDMASTVIRMLGL